MRKHKPLKNIDWDCEFQTHKKKFAFFYQACRRQLAKSNTRPKKASEVDDLILKFEQQQKECTNQIVTGFQHICSEVSKTATEKQMLTKNDLFDEIWCNDKLAETYFEAEEIAFTKQKEKQVASHSFDSSAKSQYKPNSLTFENLLAHEQCSVCQNDEYDSENFKIQCAICECTVHSECVGEEQNEAEIDLIEENSVWICPVCKINKELQEKSFKKQFQPECVFCGLSDGLMRPTYAMLKEVKMIPGFSQISSNSVVKMTFPNLLRKEKDFQFKLLELQA